MSSGSLLSQIKPKSHNFKITGIIKIFSKMLSPFIISPQFLPFLFKKRHVELYSKYTLLSTSISCGPIYFTEELRTSTFSLHLSLPTPQKCKFWPGPWADLILNQLYILECKRREGSLLPRALWLLFEMQFIIIQMLATLKRVRTSEKPGATHWNYQASPPTGPFPSCLCSVALFSPEADFSSHSENMGRTTINSLPRTSLTEKEWLSALNAGIR